MEHKHIRPQSRGRDSQRRYKHPHKHQRDGAAGPGILHSVSSTWGPEESRVNGSGWVYPLILSLSLIRSVPLSLSFATSDHLTPAG